MHACYDVKMFVSRMCLACRCPVLQAEWPTLSLQSGGIFSISTCALSLLLVFRTNSSYEVREDVGGSRVGNGNAITIEAVVSFRAAGRSYCITGSLGWQRWLGRQC